jgi:hypothetical protein
MLIILFNLALILLVSFVTELIYLDKAITSINQTVPTAIESALTASMESEEMFYYGDNGSWKDKDSSDRISSNNSNANVLAYYKNNSWVTTDLYRLAMIMDKQGLKTLPTASQISSFSLGTNDTECMLKVYDWLFGKGTYTSGTSLSTEANTRIQNYVNFVTSNGGTIKNQMFLYQEDADGYVDTMGFFGNAYSDGTSDSLDKGYMVEAIYQMGYNFGTASGINSDFHTTGKWTNSALQTPLKQGKTMVLSTAGGDEVTYGANYLLTPYSLGYTYLDDRVVKPAIMANLTSLMQLQLYANNDSTSVSQGDGAIEHTAYFAADTDKTVGAGALLRRTGTKTQVKTEDVTDNGTVNNGEFEFIANTDNIDVKIEYTVINMYDEKNEALVNAVEGYLPADYDTNAKTNTGIDADTMAEFLSKTDTKQWYDIDQYSVFKNVTSSVKTHTDDELSGNRVVAKVTTTLQLDIPYKNSFMTWFRKYIETRQQFDDVKTSSNINHYGVLKLQSSGVDTNNLSVDTSITDIAHYYPTIGDVEDSGELYYNTDHLEYKYVTYVAISR